MPVVVVSACRTAIGSFGGSLKDVTAADLGAVVIRDAIARAGVPAGAVDDVLMGCVLQAGAGMNVARQAAVKAGLPDAVPAMTINRVCGSGLQAVASAAQAIRAGDASIIVAGGTESMSRAPYLLPQARWGLRMGHAEIVDSMIADGLTCAIGACHMGITAEEIATRYGIDRAAQDAFALESQQRAAAALADGSFDAEIVPVLIPQKKGAPLSFARDEYPRAATTTESLAALRPAFSRTGSVTAGNASGLNDGAAALVVADEARARALRLPRLATVVASAVAGVEPMVMGLGPVPAIRKVLDKAGWSVADVDLFELNEAFAVQALAVARDLDLPADRVNVCGGAVALGHPIGASGARILVTLLHALQRRQAARGVAALCIGGGMGIAVAVERLTPEA
jgi:acetyl-CoA C-acetyltransferase